MCNENNLERATVPTPLFALGYIVVTAGAIALLNSNAMPDADLLARHECGNWGEAVSPEGAQANADAVSNGGIDFAASAPDLMVNIEADASQTMRTMHKGIAAIGHLLALASPEIETREVPCDVVEALGWLINELSDLAAVADYLATTCRRYTHDYSPPNKNW